MLRRVALKEARFGFGGLVRAVGGGERLVLTSYGRDVGGVVSAEEVKLLERLEASGELGVLKARYPGEV